VPRESLRGVGRDASGPHTFTVQIHHYISEHPGVTKDEIIQLALDRDWVDRGYAHRAYARSLNRARAKARTQYRDGDLHKGAIPAPRRMPDETPASVAAKRSDKAVIFAVKTVLAGMLKAGSVAVDEEGGMRAMRGLRATGGIRQDQIITTPEGNRQIASEIELLRALRPYLDRMLEPNFKMTLDVRRKLKRWAEATYVHRPPHPSNEETTP
jgi:hypothetical protein